MTVYGLNVNNQSNEVELFLSQLAKETSAANLLNEDLNKYGCRIFHLFEAEVMNKFNIPLKETYRIVFEFFKNNELSIDINKKTFTSNLFDYSIKEK